MATTALFRSIEELAAFGATYSAVFLVIDDGTDVSDLIGELERLATERESVVRVPRDSLLFKTLEAPESLPAVGVWSCRGVLVGYRDPSESVQEFLDYVRPYCR